MWNPLDDVSWCRNEITGSPFVSVKISSTFLLSSQEGILAGHAVGTEGYFAAEKIAVGRRFPFVISQW